MMGPVKTHVQLGKLPMASQLAAARQLARARFARLVQLYSAHPRIRHYSWLVAYVWYALYSTYRGLRPSRKSRRDLAKSGASPASSSATASNEAAVKHDKRNGPRRKSRVEVDAVFFDRLNRIFAIVIPSLKSREAYMLVIHSFALVFRTILSLFIADLDGRIVAALVRGHGRTFLKRIAIWMCVAVPVSLPLRTCVLPK